jgi:hypothetical protein
MGEGKRLRGSNQGNEGNKEATKVKKISISFMASY